jgi:threonine-phosphate decarboxylase
VNTDFATGLAKSTEPVHGGNVEQIARTYGLRPEEIIDFSANINPTGPPSRVMTRLAELSSNTELISRYPEADCHSLREALAAYVGLSSECIIVANGSAALMDVVLRALKPKRCLLPVPAFSEYRRALTASGCNYAAFVLDPNQNFTLDVDALEMAWRQNNCDLCIISNPHNPSGSVISSQSLLGLSRRAAADKVTVLVDEAFIEYAPDASISRAIPALPNVVVLRSITKFFALAGMRVGYALANRKLAAILWQQVPSWPVSSLASIAAIEALSDVEYAERTRVSCETERKWLFEMLVQLGFRVFPSAANFLLMKLPVEAPSVSFLNERLIIEHHILIRDCDSYEGLERGMYMRVAVKDDTANRKLIHALKEVLA